MSDEPRVMTQKEVQERVMEHVWTMTKYWATTQVQVPRPYPNTVQERLEGLAFSILTMFDGSSMDIPALEIYPNPHPEDKEFCRGEGENWWPQLEDEVTVHGPDMLHELWSGYGDNMPFDLVPVDRHKLEAALTKTKEYYHHEADAYAGERFSEGVARGLEIALKLMNGESVAEVTSA